MLQLPARERALAAARSVWGENWSPTMETRAPGRLELIGNHVDYNGGPVLAAAIDRETFCLVKSADEPGIAVIMSDRLNYPELIDPASLRKWCNQHPPPHPVDYIRGVIATALDHGDTVRDSVQIAVAGDVPIGFGLSSSASLCVALTLALHQSAPDNRELVLRAQEAENRAGAPCGTMDQSASVGGHVILYDGGTVSWDVIAPELGEYVFAVANSGVSRALGSSSYPTRVAESRKALGRANDLLGTRHKALADVTSEELERLERAGESKLPAVLKQRIRHVTTECARVREGVIAMRSADWPRFGELMTASGRSSAIDYEISHPRVESIITIALGVSGVAGARMMGGGEGGTALVLLKRGVVSALMEALQKDYYAQYPMADREPVRVFRFAPGANQYPWS